MALKTEINLDLVIVAARTPLAFHKTRRAPALRLFYNFSGGDEDNLESRWKDCVECGAHHYICGKLQSVSQLKAQGLKFIGEFRPKGRRSEWVI